MEARQLAESVIAVNYRPLHNLGVSQEEAGLCEKGGGVSRIQTKNHGSQNQKNRPTGGTQTEGIDERAANLELNVNEEEVRRYLNTDIDLHFGSGQDELHQ